tara:strand:- start:376 stop:699 length:324 start_codon:yes stop_codon:yes gene_type:complete
MAYFGSNAAEVSCAWDGNSTIAGSHGVSSVSDLGTGQTRCNFSTSFGNTNYTAVVGGAASNTNGAFDSFIVCNQKANDSIIILIAFPSGLNNGGTGGANTNLACFSN